MYDEPSTAQTHAALVTGASRRIGRALALGLAADGWPVVLSYRNDREGAEETAAQAVSLGVEAKVLQADLADPDDAQRLVEDAIAWCGRLGLLVNNAARFDRTPIDEMMSTDFETQMHSNARGPFVTMLHAGRHMRDAGGGLIVNIADVAGLSPWAGFVPYSASKAALISMTKGFARALAPTVRVCALAPGPILPPAGAEDDQGAMAVEKTLLKRYGDPADLLAGLRFFVRARYVTGYTLPVDGGRSA